MKLCVRYFILLISNMFLISCTPSSSGSLITDAMSVTDCPQNSCASDVADPARTALVLTSSSSLAMPTGSSFAEVSGDCYASLYPNNFLNVQVFNSNNVQLNNALILPNGFTARCNNGKFYIPISLEGQAAGTYSVSASLVVIDSSGAQIVPPFKTVQATLIYRP